MRTTHNWTDAVIADIRDITPTVREFSIRPADGSALLPFDAGSHLQIQVLVNGQPQARSYSLVGHAGEGVYRIAVKRLDEGRGGSLAMWRLEKGDRVTIGDPQNHFPLAFDAPSYLLVAGGIGVTPIVRMAQVLASRGAKVRMLYGARGDQELAYGDSLKEALGDKFVANTSAPFDFAAEIASLEPGAQLYICGPVPMLDAVKKAWADSGREMAHLRYETFGNSGRFAPQPFRVEIPRHKLAITVNADCSLIDALEMAGVETLSDCRRGECGLCVMDVLSVDGEIDHRDVFLSEHEKQENKRICACVSRVVGSITIDSAYREEAAA